jgi:integrase
MVEMRLRYVFRVVDKSGKARYYFRAKGTTYALQGEVGSAAFLKSYNALLSAHYSGALSKSTGRGRRLRNVVPQERPREWLPGTIGWLATEYLKSKQYLALAQSTQRLYRRELDHIRRRIGSTQVARLDVEDVETYCELISRQRSPATADLHLGLISSLWKFGRGFPECKRKGRSNPTADIDRRYRTACPHRPWPQAVQRRFLEVASSSVRLAFYMLLYTGQRRADIVHLKWTSYDGRSLRLVQSKTGQAMAIRVHSVLRLILDQTPRVHENILTHGRARPYSPDTLSGAFKRILRMIDASQYTLHGLRKTTSVLLAELGRSEYEIMAVLGHSTPKMAAYYCRQARRTELTNAAITAWERAETTVVPQPTLQAPTPHTPSSDTL